MSATSFDGLMARLKQDYASLSPQYQAGAKYLMDYPEEVAVNSMRAIASSANVHPSTLVRLAQELGYDGWPALKAIFVGRIRYARDGYAKKAADISGKGESGDVVSELFAAQRDNIDATAVKARASLLKAAELIEAGRQVYIAGFLGSYPIAYTFQYLYGLFRPTVQLVSGSAGLLEMGVRAMQEGDTLVVISFAPYGAEQIRVVKAARHKNVKVVAITDSKASPIALEADVSILAGFDSPSFFPSIVAGVAVVESLAELLFLRQGQGAVQRIELAEREFFEKGVYLR